MVLRSRKVGSSSNCCTEQREEKDDFEIKKPPCSHIPSVDTEELSEEQKTIVRRMLEEEEESFSQTDDDVGCAEELQVDINLTDSIPVQKRKRYNSIPQLLYAEVKQYVEDLLNRDWIQKSRSAYSSPVVCVRERDGTLRLHRLPAVECKKQSVTAIPYQGCKTPYGVWAEISGSPYLIKGRLIIKVL